MTSYCAALARAGFDTNPLAKYGMRASPGPSRCTGSDGRWWVAVTEPSPGRFGAVVMSFPALERFVLVCKAHPHWCST